MRLAFLCGGLEPGRDGVGDYTRLLAAECVRRGNEVRLFALNDRHVSGLETGEQESEGVRLGCERFSAGMDWEERFEALRRALDRFNPEVVSLQFVPYAFQPKGIPWQLARGLERALGGRPLEVMFHELWIGFGERAPVKERLVGMLQRRCILGLVRRLRPGVVHTSNATYRELLQKGGVEALELPIFGNIPIAPADASTLDGLPADAERGDWLVGLFFGTIHPEWNAADLMEPLLHLAQREHRRVCLISAGRLGASGEAAWNRMSAGYAEEARFVRVGELPAPEISAWMQAADFGVAVSPWCLMGKSGAAAAMVDHGLPVVFTRTEGAPEHDSPLFFRCGPGLDFPFPLVRRAPSRRLGEICARFLDSLPIGSARKPL